MIGMQEGATGCEVLMRRSREGCESRWKRRLRFLSFISECMLVSSIIVTVVSSLDEDEAYGSGIESWGTSDVGRRALNCVLRMVVKVVGLSGPAVRGALRNEDDPEDFEPKVRLSSAVILSESLGRAAGFLWMGRGTSEKCCWWTEGEEGNENPRGDSLMGEVGRWIASMVFFVVVVVVIVVVIVVVVV